MTIDVHRITAPWDERFATWSRSAEAFDPAVAASFTSRGAEGGGDVAFELTDLVRAWIDGAVPNYGVMLAARDPGPAIAPVVLVEKSRRPRG